MTTLQPNASPQSTTSNSVSADERGRLSPVILIKAKDLLVVLRCDSATATKDQLVRHARITPDTDVTRRGDRTARGRLAPQRSWPWPSDTRMLHPASLRRAPHGAPPRSPTRRGVGARYAGADDNSRRDRRRCRRLTSAPPPRATPARPRRS